MRHTQFIAVLAVSLLAFSAPQVAAVPIFSESFEYGSSTGNLEAVSAGLWDQGGSGVLKYVHDVNLDHPGLDGEAGGSFSEEFDGSGSRFASRNDPNYSYGSIGTGDAVYYAGLIQFNEPDIASIEFNATSGVSSVHFGIESDGDVYVTHFSTDGAGNTLETYDTGLDVSAGDDATHLFVLRASKGAGSSPTDSFFDLWLNPASIDALASPADWSSIENSKWGRDSSSFDAVRIRSGGRNHIDEIRVAASLDDLGLASAGQGGDAIPEPTTALLALLGVGGLIARRRRKAG